MTHELSDESLAAEPDPLSWFSRWYDDARGGQTDPPNAMVLNTTDNEGRADARVVLLAELDDAGFLFMTNYESRKGQQLATSPYAALVFHWPEQGRQVRVRGPVGQVDATTSDAYFASRPRSSQIGAWASDQSHPLPGGTAELDQRVAQATSRWKDVEVSRPPHWGGYRLVPLEIELWQSGDHRLHCRYRFTRDGPDFPWTVTRLHP